MNVVTSPDESSSGKPVVLSWSLARWRTSSLGSGTTRASGVSWALRELGKRDARAVRAFLAAHDNTLAALVRREVENKLDTGLKRPRRAPRRG